MNATLDAIRHRIEHEDNLVNQRLSWLVASQSFLVTAFAFLLNAPPQARLPAYDRTHHLLIGLLPWVALACIGSMARLRAAAARHAGADDLPIHSTAGIRRLGLAAPVAIPAVFLLLWLAMLRALNG